MKRFLLQENTRIIDLSLPLREGFPSTWPGMKEFQHIEFKNFPTPEDPCRTCWFSMDEHCGTHCDAAGHFVQPDHANSRDSLSGEFLDLESMQGYLQVIDVRHLVGTADQGKSPIIGPDTIYSWEKENHLIEKGDIVAFLTGWDTLYFTNRDAYLENPVAKKSSSGWPAPSKETVIYLFEKGVNTLAIDAPSIGAIHDGVSVHQVGLQRRMIFIEGLTSLDKLPIAGSYFMFLPLKLADSSGCPGRAIAYIQEK